MGRIRDHFIYVKEQVENIVVESGGSLNSYDRVFFTACGVMLTNQGGGFTVRGAAFNAHRIAEAVCLSDD